MSKGTTARNVRVSDDLWDAAKEAGDALGTTPSAEMVKALRRLVMRHARVQRQQEES